MGTCQVKYSDALEMHDKVRIVYSKAQAIHRKNGKEIYGGEVYIKKALDYGSTYFVSREIFMALTQGPCTSLPLDTRITPDLFPTPQGVIIFDEVAYKAGKIPIGGLIWDASAYVVTPPDAPLSAPPKDPGVMVCSMEATTGRMRMHTPLDPGYFATWRYAQTLRQSLALNLEWSTDKDDPDGVVTNMGHRFLATLLLFMKQEILVQHRERAAAPQQRRIQRSGWKHSGNVNVIRLRRAAQHNNHNDDHIPAEVRWSCQWGVRGHWRTYKPRGARPDPLTVWVDPYVKGPADKPLKIKTNLFAVTR